MIFDNLEYVSARDRAGLAYQQKLFGLSGAPGEPSNGKEFARVIAEAAGLDGGDSPAAGEGDDFFGEDGFGFDDFIDLINPLQHLPIVSTIYREITGDTISDGARIFGDALFGGPIGFAVAIGNVAVKQVSGQDIGELALSLFDSDVPENEILTADLSPAPEQGSLNVDGLSAPGSAFAPDYLDRMSEEEKALLLSSLGLAPESGSKSDARGARRGEPENPLPRASAEPGGAKAVWPVSPAPPGGDPSSPDWIAAAMTRALDKYEQSFGAARARGDRLDSRI